MITPEVGMGATKVWHSDATPFTIIEVKSPTKIVVQMDKTSQGEIVRNENGPTYEVSLRNNGRWVAVGDPKNAEHFAIGHRIDYTDPHF